MQSTQSPLFSLRKTIANSSLKSSFLRLQSQHAETILDPLEVEDKFDEQLADNVLFKKMGMGFAGETTFGRGKFNQQGTMWITAGADGEGKVWDVQDPNGVDFCKEITSFKTQGKICEVLFHPRFGSIPPHAPNLISSTSTGQLSLHTFKPELSLQSSITLSAHSSRISSMTFLPANDRYILLTSHDHTFSLWDLSKLTKIYEQKGHESQIQTGSIHGDGALFFTGDLSGCGMLWDLRIGKGIYEINEGMSYLCSDFHPNGYELAISGRSNLISIYDLRRKKLLRSIPAHTKQISSLAYHPRGLFLSSGSHDNLTRLWHGKYYSSLEIEDSQMIETGKIGNIDVRERKIGTATVDGRWSIWMIEDKVKIEE